MVARNRTWVRCWPRTPFILGFLLLLPSIYAFLTSPADQPFALPPPGSASVINVANRGYRALLGDDEFMLFYEVGVPPEAEREVVAQRLPVFCKFRLLDARSGRIIAEIPELDHAYEDSSDKRAGFSSEPFALPSGTTRVKLTNMGCRDGSSAAAGLGRIYWFKDTSLVPIGAFILNLVGLLSIAIGLAVGSVRAVRARTCDRRFARG